MSHLLFISPLAVFLTSFVLVFLLSFISKRKHLLATLLSLEGLMLMIFGIFFWLSSVVSFSNFSLIFLTLTACEGALGLSLLVSLVRTHGGDSFNSLNALQC
uniref:NADH-ubiquinone oxidoreductase chain 4L n=2 Tax=Daphnia TaxID=6668 RepID=A0A0S3CQJ8_DAPPU|nr:NADH dehydrogenase subunit 4L [Daphnia pulex]QVT15609.1 NADH dehydrogenase subunit 4L [Daphnia mitsukuri]